MGFRGRLFWNCDAGGVPAQAWWRAAPGARRLARRSRAAARAELGCRGSIPIQGQAGFRPARSGVHRAPDDVPGKTTSVRRLASRSPPANAAAPSAMPRTDPNNADAAPSGPPTAHGRRGLPGGARRAPSCCLLFLHLMPGTVLCADVLAAACADGRLAVGWLPAGLGNVCRSVGQDPPAVVAGDVPVSERACLDPVPVREPGSEFRKDRAE